jgi:pyruvate dehydrogenase E2 component (dihydrolipoamide acetyltransferase)
MEEGTIVRWLRASGDEVRLGEPIAEIETDKATVEYEADAAGFLQIVANQGESHSIGTVIGHLLADAVATAATPVALAEPNEAAPAPSPAPVVEAATAPEPAFTFDVGAGIKASPVARRTATRLGIDLGSIRGSGPAGRIVKADVLAAEHGPSNGATATPATTVGAKGTIEVIELSRTQQVIARRMASAKATIPEFHVSVDVDAESAFAMRGELRGRIDPLPSINDILIKACALALRAHPGVNAAYTHGRFERYGRVNIGVAVTSESSLVVPTVFDADMLSLTQIAAATRALAAKVRDGSVAPADLSGGTFTVSNLGMFGVSRFTAVINPPQAAILAVGAASPRAFAGPGGTIAARRVMELTLSADHRIVYGADAAGFLATVRERLQRPLTLLV